MKLSIITHEVNERFVYLLEKIYVSLKILEVDTEFLKWCTLLKETSPL